MKRHTDDKTSTQIIEAVNRAKSFAAKQQMRYEAKLWAPIQAPLDLKQALSRLTKDELDTIRKNLDIKNISSLKKADLIDKLAEHIPAKVADIFNRFDQERYQLMKDIMQNGAWVSAASLELAKVQHLRNYGLLFPGTLEQQHVLVMPTEIITEYRKLE